jgi:hypothetical protein
MVDILAAKKHLSYKNGWSRILCIGTTKIGADRRATSAVNKANDVFCKLHGVKTIEVHIASCARRRNVQTWRQLESALLDTFRKRSFELPKCNQVRPRPNERMFGSGALLKAIARVESA